MKISIFSIIITISIFISAQKKEFSLQNGDLIFQESCSEGINTAIKESTSSVDNYNFTHVGMVWMAFNNPYVIEATHPKVKITMLGEYLNPEDKCKPHSVVGRVKEEYQALIPQAIYAASNRLGKKYDDAFDITNDEYYCSELIYYAFKEANNGKEFFPLQPMTFKSLQTGEFPLYWVEHFKKLGIPIPEGKLGNNPGDMSKSELIDIIYYYE